MKPVHKRIFIASLLATLGLAAVAQAPQTPNPAPAPSATQRGPMMGERMGHGDPAKMQQRMAERHGKHMAELKAKLKLTPTQEGAWTTFTGGMQPPARKMDRAQMQQMHAEMDKLPTPERIDKMRALRAERMKDMTARMTQREEAVKTFYATLTPEQQKVFDAEHQRHRKEGSRGGHHGGHHRGGMGM
jgi:Spy/CpxP family protein refolding chaperone